LLEFHFKFIVEGHELFEFEDDVFLFIHYTKKETVTIRVGEFNKTTDKHK